MVFLTVVLVDVGVGGKGYYFNDLFEFFIWVFYPFIFSYLLSYLLLFLRVYKNYYKLLIISLAVIFRLILYFDEHREP